MGLYNGFKPKQLVLREFRNFTPEMFANVRRDRVHICHEQMDAQFGCKNTKFKKIMFPFVDYDSGSK